MLGLLVPHDSLLDTSNANRLCDVRDPLDLENVFYPALGLPVDFFGANNSLGLRLPTPHLE
jgi:hypothetical protein